MRAVKAVVIVLGVMIVIALVAVIWAIFNLDNTADAPSEREGTIADASSVAKIFVNTNLAAAGGVMAAIVLNQIFYGKVDLTMALNGALAGLVSITAEPLTPAIWQSVIIGAVGIAVAQTGDGDDAVSAEDFVGVWESHDGVYTQFNLDGTYSSAWSLDEVSAGTFETGTWSFDGTEFVWVTTAGNCSPGDEGRYSHDPARRKNRGDE